MDIGWNRISTRLRFLCAQLAIVGTLAYLTFLWLGVFQRPEIIESSISVAGLRKRAPQDYSIHSEATLADGFGNNPSKLHSMDGCLVGWHLEVLRKANNHQGAAQVCRINDGSGHWQCAPGWQQLPVDPFCVLSSSPSKPADRQPQYAQVSDIRKLLFIHVPKAGGTSIETSFLFKEQREKLGGHYLGGHHKITAFNEQFFKNYHKFGIVRHPCSRLISVWSYYSQGLGNKGDKTWVDKFMDNVTKSSFVAFVEHTLYPVGPVQIETQPHLQTQTGMIFRKNGQFGLDQLLIFEKWNDSMDELGDRINVDVTVLKSTHKLSSHHKTCQESYTRKMWAKMTKLYAMDFCILGYSTEFEEVNTTPPVGLNPETLTLRFQKCASKLRQGV